MPNTYPQHRNKAPNSPAWNSSAVLAEGLDQQNTLGYLSRTVLVIKLSCTMLFGRRNTSVTTSWCRSIPVMGRRTSILEIF